MKSFLFNEDFLFPKPQFLNTIVLGAGYKNLTLKITDNSDKIHSSKEHHHHSADNIFESVSFNNIKNFSEKNMEIA